MQTDSFEIRTNQATYLVERVAVQGSGIAATVTAFEPDGALIYSDRLNLDRASAREKFATKASLQANDLLLVRDSVLKAVEDSENEAALEAPDPEAEEAGRRILDSPDLLDAMTSAIRQLGFAGSESLPKIVYLCLSSRLLDSPINLVVMGPSAAGKSYLVNTVTRLFPASAIYVLSGMSERLLAYTDADLQNRVLIISEASVLHRDGIGASLLRSLTWEGRISYEFVEKTQRGIQPRRIEKHGPTGFITTTTTSIEPELATRALAIHLPDTPSETREIVKSIALHSNGKHHELPNVQAWEAAQQWLVDHGKRDVTIPFAEQLAGLVPVKQVRWRRDFVQLLALIKAHALLHQRQRSIDDVGRIIAEPRDYAAIYEIASPVFSAIAADGVTTQTRETVQAVRALTVKQGSTTSVQAVADYLKVDKSTASRRISRACGGEWLINDEEKLGHRLQLRVGNPLPEDRAAIPSPEELFDQS